MHMRRWERAARRFFSPLATVASLDPAQPTIAPPLYPRFQVVAHCKSKSKPLMLLNVFPPRQSYRCRRHHGHPRKVCRYAVGDSALLVILTHSSL